MSKILCLLIFTVLGFVLSLFFVGTGFAVMVAFTFETVGLYTASLIIVFLLFGFVSHYFNVNEYYVLPSFIIGSYIGVRTLSSHPNPYEMSSWISTLCFFSLYSLLFLLGNLIKRKAFNGD